MSRGAAVRSALGLAVLLTVTACSGPGDTEQGQVVVTTNILGDITANIVGDEAEVTVLMAPNSDPHSFGISAPQAAAMEQAGLLVYNGLGLEEGVLRNVETAREAGVATVEVGAAVDPIDYTSDESEGQPDPHFWTDPSRVGTAVDLIAEQVIDNVPGVDEATIRDNADRYRDEIDELDGLLEEKFAEIPRSHRKLVTNHHVFGYLAQRYDFEVIGAVIPSGTTLASPSAADLEALSTTIREAGVPAIFADSSQSDRLAQVLAEQAGLEVSVVSLFSESLSAEGGGAQTYVEMMRANSDSIADGLLGQD